MDSLEFASLVLICIQNCPGFSTEVPLPPTDHTICALSMMISPSSQYPLELARIGTVKLKTVISNS